MRLGSYLALLRENPAFARLYAAQLISFAGDWFATVALLGLALELTGLAGLAALVLVLQTGGFAVAAPLAGILADRIDRRRLLIAADLARVPVALGFLLARDAGTLWIAFACVTLLAVGAAVFEPTHGSAPKYTGQNKVNPMAMMLSGVMLLRHLKELSAADRMEGAIADVIREGRSVTYDMKPHRDDPTAVGTSEVADAVIERLKVAA